METADDILEELGWASGAFERPDCSSKSYDNRPFAGPDGAGEVYRLERLDGGDRHAAPKLLARLTELELNGFVTGVGGGRFAQGSPLWLIR